MQLADLAARLPDVPRWIEVRDLLLSGEGRLVGAVAIEPLSFVLAEEPGGLACVVGLASAVDVRAASDRARDVLAFDDNRDHVHACLPDRDCERALLFERPERGQETPVVPPPNARGSAAVHSFATGAARLLDVSEIEALAHATGPAAVPPDLLAELQQAARTGSPVGAAFCDGAPVSFCYASSVTEGLWDVSIDTLEPFRGRGFAEAAVRVLIEYWADRGRRPVWGALESNAASRRVAEKLGFREVDAIYVLSRPSAAP
jgi:RimJ/RimL family protein N-acetyltransferase